MPRSFEPYPNKHFTSSFYQLCQPVKKILPETPILESRGDRPLKMTFEDQLNTLIFFHLEEHKSVRHLIQVLKEDDFNRGIEQLEFIFQKLGTEASNILPDQHAYLGKIVAFDGSLIDAVLSMTWADYRKGSKKARIHLGFNLNQGIPAKIFFTDGNGAERPFVSQILSPGQTGIGDRGYQEHKLFDSLQVEGKSFAIRIKANATKTCIKEHEFIPDSIVLAERIFVSAEMTCPVFRFIIYLRKPSQIQYRRSL